MKKLLLILVLFLSVFTLASCTEPQYVEYELVQLNDEEEIKTSAGLILVVGWYNEKEKLNYEMFVKNKETGAVYYKKLSEFEIEDRLEIYFIEEGATPEFHICDLDNDPNDNNYLCDGNVYRLYIPEGTINYDIRIDGRSD